MDYIAIKTFSWGDFSAQAGEKINVSKLPKSLIAMLENIGNIEPVTKIVTASDETPTVN